MLSTSQIEEVLQNCLIWENRKHYTKLQWSVLQQSLLQLQLYSTTPLQENYNFNLTYNYTLYNHNCNLQPNYITLQLHLQDTRPTTRNYRCNYNCNCCNCNYNFNHKPLPLPLQQLEERVVVWVDLKSLKVWKNCVQCAVYSVQCNVQCSESVCERLEAGGRRWQACRAKKQEPHTHSATGHNIALPRQTK